jgi:hypothetical protein
MASGRAADWEDPSNSRRKAARSLDRDPIRELHQGRRSYAPHQEAGHMTAPDHIANATSKPLHAGAIHIRILENGFPRERQLSGHEPGPGNDDNGREPECQLLAGVTRRRNGGFQPQGRLFAREFEITPEY